MRSKLVAVSAVLVAAFAFAPGRASAASYARCDLPTFSTNWIDYADGSVPFWKLFAQPGVIAAASNFVYPPMLRAGGAQVVYWDMYMNRRVGTPTAPADPNDVVARADKLYDYAARSTECANFVIGENELFGAGLPTPWSVTNAQYRANVLLFLRRLAADGAHPYLAVNSAPYTEGDAGDWWRQVSDVADIVREVYFSAPQLYQKGPVLGNRTLRNAFRTGITDFTSIGISARKLGIFLGFQTEPGQGGREGLKPATAWFETIKWQVLSARQVAEELRFATIWSWGWANWGDRGKDPDKPAAACVYLWTRAHAFCNGPAAAGGGFDASLTEGQINLAPGTHCVVDKHKITEDAISRLARLTGDREAAATALFARSVERENARVTTRQILAAERAVVLQRFRGSAAAYRAALTDAHATPQLARDAIGDQLRRSEIEAGFRVAPASPAAEAAFYLAYPDVLVRAVTAKPAAPWLGGRTSGLALSSTAPPQVFRIRTGRKVSMLTMDGRYAVKALGAAVPLGAIPLERARPAIAAALARFARGAEFERWTTRQQSAALDRTVCVHDDLPAPGAVDLSTFLPFLSPVG